MNKYMYSIPFLIMAIGFVGLIKTHIFAIVPMFACITFGISNYIDVGEGVA